MASNKTTRNPNAGDGLLSGQINAINTLTDAVNRLAQNSNIDINANVNVNGEQKLKKIDKEVVQLQKDTKKLEDLKISEKDIFESKSVQDRIGVLKPKLEAAYKKRYDENGNEKNRPLGVKDTKAFMQAYKELENYYKMAGKEMEEKYKEIFDNIMDNIDFVDTIEDLEEETAKNMELAEKHFNATRRKAEKELVGVAKKQPKQSGESSQQGQAPTAKPSQSSGSSSADKPKSTSASTSAGADSSGQDEFQKELKETSQGSGDAQKSLKELNDEIDKLREKETVIKRLIRRQQQKDENGEYDEEKLLQHTRSRLAKNDMAGAAIYYGTYADESGLNADELEKVTHKGRDVSSKLIDKYYDIIYALQDEYGNDILDDIGKLIEKQKDVEKDLAKKRAALDKLKKAKPQEPSEPKVEPKTKETKSEKQEKSKEEDSRKNTFAADIKQLENYKDANESFVNQLIASVTQGQLEYDQAMEQLKEHIKKRHEEIQNEQEKNLRVNTQVQNFTTGVKPILEDMGLAEGELPDAYSKFIDDIQKESINGEEAVKKFAEAVGYTFDEVAKKWKKIQSSNPPSGGDVPPSEYVKKTDDQIYSSAMELAKNRETILEAIGQREIDIANKTAGETKDIYQKMALETYNIFKQGKKDGDYEIDDKLLQVKKHVEDLQEQISQEKDPVVLSSLNEQLDEARIKLIALANVFKESALRAGVDETQGLPFGSEAIDRYSRTQRENYKIGESNFSISQDDKEYWDTLTDGIKTEKDLTEAINKRKQALAELEEKRRVAEDKTYSLDSHSNEYKAAFDQEMAINDEYNEARQNLYNLIQLQQNWGKSIEEASKIDISFLSTEWREEENAAAEIDAMINRIIEDKKKLAETSSSESPILSGETPKRVAYHYGNISSGRSSHQFGDEINAWFTGQRNGGRAWADGTGTYVTSDASQYNKGDFSDPLKRFYAIDTSNLKLFEAHTEETAEQYYNFIHQLEQFCIKAGSGFDGFDANLQNIDANSLYQTFQKVFPDIKLTFDEFNSFISDMTALVQESGLKADGSQNARQMFDFKKKNGTDDIKTRFMKMLGFQGTDLSGTSFDSLRDGSVLFDTANVKDNIIKTGQTIQDVMTQTQNSIRETSDAMTDLNTKSNETPVSPGVTTFPSQIDSITESEQEAGQAGQQMGEQISDGMEKATASTNKYREALEKSFNTSGKKDATYQLKQAYEEYQKYFGENGIEKDKIVREQSDEGRIAAYNYAQALKEAINKGISETNLSKYRISDFSKYTTPDEVDDEFADVREYIQEQARILEELGNPNLSEDGIKALKEYMDQWDLLRNHKEGDFYIEDGILDEELLQADINYLQTLKELLEDIVKLSNESHDKTIASPEGSTSAPAIDEQNKLQGEMEETGQAGQQAGEQAAKGMKALGDATKQTRQEQEKLSNSIDGISEPIDDAADSAEKLTQKMTETSSQTQGEDHLQQELGETSAAEDDASAAADKNAEALQRQQQAAEKAAESQDKLNNEINEDPSTVIISPEQIDNLTQNLTNLLSEIQTISNAFKSIDDESGIPAIFKQIQDITTAINGLKDTLGSEDFVKNISGGFFELVEQIQQLVNVLNSGIDFNKLKGQVLSIPENEINKETTTLSSLESKIRDGIINAIDDKNKAFTKEGKHVKTIVDEENGYLNSLQEKITAIANSLKNMLKEGVDENPFKDLFDSINESKDALKNFAEILAKSKADRKAAIKDVKKESGKEAANELKSIFKQTDIITPETEGWDLLVEKIRLAGVEMEDVVSIQRNLRKSGKELLESFQITDVYGGKRTVGINTDGVITQNDVVWKDRSKDLDKLEANINKLSTAKTRKEFDDLSQKIQETIDDLTKLQESGNESILFGDQLEILKNEFDSVSQSATKMFDTMDRDNAISSIRDQISSLSNVTTDEEFRDARKSIDSLISGLQQYVDKGLLAQNAVDALRDSFKLNTAAAFDNLDAIRQQENEAELAAARERALKEIGNGKADYVGIKAANKAVYDQYKKNVDEEAQIEQRVQSVRNENNKKNLAQYQEQLRIITEFKDQYKALMDQMINSVLSGNGLGDFVQDYKDLLAGFTGARNQVADMFANGQITASQGRRANLGFNEAYNAKNDIAKTFSGSTAIQDYIAKTQDSINKLSTTNSVDQINKLSSSIQVAIDNLSMLSKVIPGLDSSVDTLSDSFGNVTANIKVDQLKKLIKAYEDAATKINNLEAQRISGKETGEQQKEATKELNQAQAAAQDGLNKLKASTEDWNRLTIKQQQDLESMFNAASSGSAKSQDALQQAMDNAAKKGQNISTQQTNRKEKRDISVATKEIERYEKFVNKLEELSTRQSRGENVATQLNRQIQGLPDALSKAQNALASLQQMFQDGSQNIHIQDLLDLTNKIAEASNRANQISLEGFDNLDKGYNTLYNTAQKYYELLNKKSENKLTLNETEWLERYKKFLDEAIKKTGIFTNETDQQLNDLEQHLSDVFKNVTRNVLDEDMIDISKMIDTAKDVDTKSVPSAYIQELDRLEQEYMQLDSTIKSVDWNGKSEQELTQLRDQFRESINSIKSGLDSLKGDQFQFMDQSYRSNMTKSIADWMSNNQKAKDAIAQIQPIFDRLSSSEALTKQQGEALVQTFKRISAEAAVAGKTGMSFAEKLRGSFGNLSRYLLSFASFYQVIGIFRQGVTVVRELDTALTEMRKVSDETLSSLQKYQFDSFDIADKVGTTAKQLQDSTAAFLRLGESFEQAKESAKNANILLNVSEFESIDAATDSLIAMSQAFNDISEEEIINKLNNIGNHFSISTNELAESLQRSAGTLKVTGSTLDEAIALTTVGNSILRNPESVGAALKTVSLRMQGTEASVKELQEMGEETENLLETTAKLRQTILDTTRVASNGFKGFDIMDANGQFKSMYETLLGLGQIWQEIGERDLKEGTTTQSYILEQLAGM